MDDTTEKRLDRIEDKLDNLFELNVDQIRVLERHSVLHDRNTEDLAVHIKRTNLLENQMTEALKPIEWARMTGRILLWISGAVIPIIALYYALK